MKGLRWLRFRHVLDVMVVLCALPLLVPLTIIAMIAVYLEDRRGPLIRLNRVGRFGTPLAVCKIRSMHAGRRGPTITGSSDARITRVGRVLRRWRLDEMPQVALVLVGRMSLIGPRPESAEFVEIGEADWALALKARPAVAGLTQIVASPWEAEHLSGEEATDRYKSIAVPAKVAIDAWYVANASPLLDLLIIRSLFAQFVLRSEWTPAHDVVQASIPAGRVLLPARQATG